MRTALLPDTRPGRALVRRPSSRMADGQITHIDRAPVDVDLAMRQWQDYVAAFTDNGWPTIEVPPADDCPDAQFVEDTMVISRDLAVIARPGVPERLPETAGAEESVRELGYRIAHIEAPGTLDGGDVLKLGGTFFVGRGGRSNDAGIAQLTEHLAPQGITVVPVGISKVLHLKTSVTALPDGTLLGYLPVIDHPELLPNLVPVPERDGWRMILLGDNKILLSTSAPRTAELLADRGYELVTVDVGEFHKMEASVTCLSVRLRGELATD